MRSLLINEIGCVAGGSLEPTDSIIRDVFNLADPNNLSTIQQIGTAAAGIAIIASPGYAACAFLTKIGAGAAFACCLTIVLNMINVIVAE